MCMSKVLTPTLCKAARVLLKWSQAELSGKAGVGVRSISRFEDEKGEQSPAVRDKLYEAFQNAGIQFIANNSDGPELDGVGLRFRPSYPGRDIKIL